MKEIFSNLYCFTLSEFFTNNYILLKNNKAIIIDCTESKPLISFIKQNNIKVLALILTHGHVDHICGVANISKEFSLIPYLNPLDNIQIELSKQIYQEYGFTEYPSFTYQELNEGKLIIEDFEIQVINTPGHTQGSISLKIDNYLFSGDTLFKNSIGRTDLPGGNYFQLINSIKEKLLILPDQTIVLPGHGEITTIHEEKIFNPFLIP